MPKGVPKAGFRVRKHKNDIPTIIYKQPKQQTDIEIENKIQERFFILKNLTNATISGLSRALIVSGPAGLGKSYTIEEILKRRDPNEINHKIVKGFVKATGLYKLLYQHKEKGKILVFDDADSIFYDDVSLNMLKAVCDTTETRKVSYLSEGSFVDEETAEKIPKTFEFEGSIIFITNLDFDALIEKKHKLTPHLGALISRSHYVDLAMKTTQDYIVRIKQAIDEGLLNSFRLFTQEQQEVIDFILYNAENMRELSLRTVLKVATIRKAGGKHWKETAKITCCKNN